MVVLAMVGMEMAGTAMGVGLSLSLRLVHRRLEAPMAVLGMAVLGMAVLGTVVLGTVVLGMVVLATEMVVLVMAVVLWRRSLSLFLLLEVVMAMGTAAPQH